MQIRESGAKDKDALLQLHRDAFGEAEGLTIAQLVKELLEDKTALPLLSLAAEEDDVIVGHILFSSVKVVGANVTQAYILSPLAVDARYQGRGIGMALIRTGLDLLKARGAEFVLVLGDPAYYSRTGFLSEHGLIAPYELDYPQAWMAQELKQGALDNIKGKVQCATSLSAAKYW